MKIKKYVDESYAFWLEDRTEELCLHLNEWYSPPNCYIDIGVRVCKLKNSGKLYMYFPFNVDITDDIDLFDALIVNENACAIFNAACTIEKEERTDDVCPIRHQKRLDYCVRLRGRYTHERIKGDFESDDQSDDGTVGVKLTVDLSDLREKYSGKDIYFRLRLPHYKLQRKFLNKSKNMVRGSLVDTPSRNTRIQYMQRINEGRSLPKAIREEEGVQLQNFGKVMSMLAMAKKYEVDDSKCFKVRLLESNLHKGYVPPKFENVNALAYQWKEDNHDNPESHKKYSFLFNLRIMRNERSILDFLIHLGYAFACAFASSLVIGFVLDWIKSLIH